ncbi:MAG: DUF5916 domain-containing protein [Vicinamibacteria bacterium]
MLGVWLLAAGAHAAEIGRADLEIKRAAGPINIDGDLSDEGWRDAVPVETWFETNPGDNTPPKVKSVGRLAYDDRFFYAAFEFSDPEPQRIRAPFSDRDNVGSDTDYGGVILDTRHDGKTGVLFLANPRGIQYDSVLDDTNGNEDSSPDFYWDSAGRITKDGWTLEIRIPFSTLRYPKTDPQTWGIMLYRNYPRAFRYQMFSTRIPRGSSCFICNENTLSGLSGLPTGGHIVAAPYVNASKMASPEGGVLGNPLQGQPLDKTAGLDVKWNPAASSALDVTVNPDFSQIESDVAQISSNERFALFYPEKRPFFLEGNELFATPIPAVYTRTITSPRWGGRMTGKVDSTAYTVLVSQDRGGGQVVLPGPVSSDFADQDFRSLVAIARVRHDIGRSFVSFLATSRDIEGGGYNRVYGPDLQWRPNKTDTVTSQFLWSDSQTPVRPDLTEQWNGQSLSGHAFETWWSHQTPHLDGFTDVRDFTDGFRADDGFVPQVGYREATGEYGYTTRPQGLLNRFRPFVGFDYQGGQGGDVLLRQYYFGAGMDGRWNFHARLRMAPDDVRAGDKLLPRRLLYYDVIVSPSRVLTGIEVMGTLGQDVDFENVRTARGVNVNLRFTVRPTNHLELAFTGARRWLNVDVPPAEGARLFTAVVERLRATYTLSSRVFLRAIGQYVKTERDPSLYVSAVNRKDADFTGSFLFAYKLNWQTVMFLGYGDDRELDLNEKLQKLDRQFFVKLSYAFQR